MSSKYALFSALLAIVVVCTASAAEHSLQDLYLNDEEFLQWVSKYSKGGENLAKIYPTWRRNADFVKHHNSLESLSYSVSLNQYAHLDSRDLVKKQQKWLEPEVEQNAPSVSKSGIPRPVSLDWRDKGVIPPVENQGQCGSAGLFAVVDAIEAYWAIHHGHLVMASLQEAIDCCMDGNCTGDVLGQPLFQCIAHLGGLASKMEYTSLNGTCQSSKFPPVVKINGGRFVDPKGSEEALADAVAKQPVAVAVDASHTSFQLYDEGVYYDKHCSSTKLDHALLVVGYGSKDGEDFWIAKNSWGSSWGVNGYILMARNKENNCGIASQPMFPY